MDTRAAWMRGRRRRARRWKPIQGEVVIGEDEDSLEIRGFNKLWNNFKRWEFFVLAHFLECSSLLYQTRSLISFGGVSGFHFPLPRN